MSEEGTLKARVSASVDLRSFFHEALVGALGRQKVSLQGETELYLVNLLVDFLSPDQLFVREPDGRLGSEPLAFMLKRAVEAPASERAGHLKRMGDTALYVSGFFSDSLRRQLVDIDYYAAMGGRAYDALGGMRRQAAGLFRELAEKFLRLVEVLSEISERAAMTSNAGLLRLYDRYQQTGSTRLRRMLESKGVFLMPEPGEVQ